MKPISGMDTNAKIERLSALQASYQAFCAKGLKLDMSRGKPCTEQLDLSDGMVAQCLPLKAADGTDCRNYGLVDGLTEAKELMAELFGITPKQIIVGGNSSLNLMYDTIARAFNHGLYGFDAPWSKCGALKFLCPSPGYDRHFAITELFGMELITVPMLETGPDMDIVEDLVKNDDQIKGIWSIPMYSNPTGITYSDETVRRLASMKAAKDFRIFWDNAYALHHLYETPDQLLNMIDVCAEAGNPDRVLMFGSTSKVTWPGSGIAIMAASEANIATIRKQMSIQTIGPDKVNQLLHVHFLKNAEVTAELMKKQANIIRPKFDVVLEKLQNGLAGKGIASWNSPRGGYFISLDVLEGTAKRVVQLAKDAGVVLTPAGATYPYGKDPLDRNIRIAPTFPPLSELESAIDVLLVCVEIAALEKLSA